MKTVTFTKFRRNASVMLSEVERGESLLVLRHGRPVAEVTPAAKSADGESSWKRPALRLSVKGAGLSAAILEERMHENVS